MKSVLILCLAVAVVAENPFAEYHERVGIPLATRIRQAEETAIKTGSRIVGGQPAPLGAHPYLVGVVISLVDGRISVCGSSMLSNTRAVTAAHCWFIPGMPVQMFTLVFGSEYLFYGGVRVDTSDVEMHTGWNGDGLTAAQWDIAIVRFNHVDYTDLIQPISLPTGDLESNDFVGVWAQVTGYGATVHGVSPQANTVQRHLSVQVISNSICFMYYGPTITSRVLCTSGAGHVGICSGDSGGPLSIVDNNQSVLIGVASFSSRCADGFPAGFVRVTEHLPWIRERL